MRVFDVARLVDGRRDDAIDDARLVVADGEVAAVGPRESVDAPPDAERVEYPDRTVVPGFVDAHVHVQGARSMNIEDWMATPDSLAAARATGDLRSLVDAGFTSVRDLGSSIGLGLREAVASGEVPGPRVFTSGRAISQTAGHGDIHGAPYGWVADGTPLSTLADGPTECRREARKRIREGVDCLKIMTTGGVLSQRDTPDVRQFTDEEIRAMTEEADRVGVDVAAHAQGAAGIEAALRNGATTVEHGFYLDDECIELLKECGGTFVPTLAIMWRITEHGDEHGVPEWGMEKAREAREAHVDAVRNAYEENTPIAAGTDFMGPELVPHGENALEMRLLVEEVGMSEMEALQSGTRIAARTLPRDDVGTLEVGNRADFAVLEHDPLADISAVERVHETYLDGERADG
ncbi:metal-dependent hydrolase family protein [Halobacterium litoreum]|uniref:Amidohydrolase family protein n=1 Tax=Halobacterium litoreum TaxID=2039234 RepID=A0ABD5NI61_9EURY|nr:amidohydrolase family protein [Halobacterium litoreum]UHH12224.1 amidohydrolase family protein [Halobacterium litoreum]